MKRLKYACIYFTLMTGFFGCKFVDPAIPIPAYIHIDSIPVNVLNPVGQGSKSAKISDAYIYVNEILVGAFQIPCTVPVLVQGNSVVSIDAGIKVDGLAAQRAIYPFYNQFTQNVNLQTGKISNLKPVVNYFQQTNFAWMENFEGVQASIIPNPMNPGDTTIKTTHDLTQVYEGRASGVITLAPNVNKPNFTYEGISSPATGFSLPSDGMTSTYLELNYKCNNSFTVGFYASAGTGPIDFATPVPVAGVNPSVTWNKIYLNLTPVLAQVPTSKYVIYLYMVPDRGVTTPVLYLDNIKLLHL